MRALFTYLLIAIFSIGTLQASIGTCVHMGMLGMQQDMQQEAPTDVSAKQATCHLMGDEVAAEEETDNSCCEGGCDSCLSLVVTFNSQADKGEQTYTQAYAQNILFALPSNHIKIPTPPPNS